MLSPQHPILLLTAIAAEARALRRAGLDATVIGIRASRLASVVAPNGTQLVLMAGVGGAIDPTLAVGDVVTDGAPIVGVKSGTILTVDRVVSTPAEKAALFAATGASVVDMEQAIVKRWAAERGMAVIGVRAISDAATDAVDPAVVGFVTDIGRPKPGVIAATLIRRPMLVPQLMRLNRDTKLALGRLAASLSKIAK